MLYPLEHRAIYRTFICMYMPCYMAYAVYHMLYTKTSFGCIANLDFYIQFENVIQHFPRCQTYQLIKSGSCQSNMESRKYVVQILSVKDHQMEEWDPSSLETTSFGRSPPFWPLCVWQKGFQFSYSTCRLDWESHPGLPVCLFQMRDSLRNWNAFKIFKTKPVSESQWLSFWMNLGEICTSFRKILFACIKQDHEPLTEMDICPKFRKCADLKCQAQYSTERDLPW